MRRHAAPVILLAIVTAWGCQRAEQPALRSVPSEPFQLELGVEPEKPIANKPATLQLTVRDDKGAPVSGARITAGLGMPFHDMGENKVEFSEKGNGVYEAQASFSMEGPWEAHVTVEKAGKSGKKVFDLRVYE